MPLYRITAPNGQTYQIEGPEGASDADVARAVMAQFPESAQKPPETTVGGNIKEAVKGFLPGAVGLLESAATGASALLPEDMEKAAREKISSVAGAAKRPFEAAPGYEQSVGRRVGEGLGSILPAVPLALMGAPGVAAGIGMGLAAGAGEARTRAEQEGATAEQRGKATALGTIPGGFDTAIDMALAALPGGIGRSLSVVRRALVSGGVEGATEAAQAIAQNAIARGVYKPDQALLESAGEEGAYGAGVGAIASVLLDMAIPGRTRGAQPAAPKATPTEGAPAETAPAPKLPLATAPGAQGELFEGAQRPPAAQPEEEKPAAAPQPGQLDLGLDFQREVEQLYLERERLKQGEQTPQAKARVNELTEQIRNYEEMSVAEQRAQAELDAQREREGREGAAKFPALAGAPDLWGYSEGARERAQGELFSPEEMGGRFEGPVAPAERKTAEPTEPTPVPPYERKGPYQYKVPLRGGETVTPFTMEDVEATGIAPSTTRGWFAQNVVGKTRGEVQALVDANPTLLTEKGKRAKILRELLAPQAAPFKEEKRNAPSRPAPTATDQGTEPRAGEPSMGVPSEPGEPIAPEPAAGVAGPPGGAAEPDGRGLVPAGQPAGQGIEAQGEQPTPVSPFAALVRATEGKPDLAPDEAPRTGPASKSPFDYKGQPSTIGAQIRREAGEGRRSVTTIPGQTLDQLKQTVATAKGPLAAALRRMVQSGKVVLAERHPSGEKIGGVFDGKRATLYADGIPVGQEMAVALHEVAAHMGLRSLLGAEQYDALINRILDMAASPTASPERALAQRALQRIPKEDVQSGAGIARDEAVAYYIEELAKAEASGELPKVGPLRAAWNRIKTAIVTALNKALGTDFMVSNFTPQEISAIANAAFMRESKTGVDEAGEARRQFSISYSTEQLINGMGPLEPERKNGLVQTIKGFKAGSSPAEPSYAAKFRTQTADAAATIEERLRSDFDGAVRNSLGKLNPMGLYRQAQDHAKLLLEYFQVGGLVKDSATGLWVVQDKPNVRPPAEVYALIDAWGAKNGYSRERATQIASRILEGVRLDAMRTANRTQGTNFLLHLKDNEIDQLVREYKADPDLQAMSKLMDEARIDMVDNMVRVGRLSPEQGAEWKKVAGYVPFDRLDDFSEGFSKIKKLSNKGLAQVGKLPELVGSMNRPVGNVFDNYLNTLGWMVGQTMKTDGTVNTLRSLEDAGYAKFLHGSTQGKPNTVGAYVGGEMKYWELPSKYDVLAFKDLNPPKATWLRMLGQFSTVLRRAVTSLPPFALKQVTDDVQRAIMTSGVKNPGALLRMSLSNFGGIAFAELRGIQHPAVRQFGKLGLTGEYDFEAGKPANSLLKDLGYKPRGKFEALMHKLDGVTRASDLAVRKAIYDQTLNETQDALLAQTRAREFINFRRRGASDFVGAMVTTIPFFNAYIQGMDVLYRAASGKDSGSSVGRAQARKMFWQRAAAVMALSSLYALGKEDDEEYAEMDLRTRDSNWIVGGAKLPVPGELGALFKVIPERVVEYLRRQGTPEEQTAWEASRTALAYIFEQYVGRTVPVPQAVKPLLEAFTNHSFFTGRELEGIYQKQQDPSMRRASNTSELAIAIANFSRDVVGVDGVSPILVDNALNGYFGSSAALLTAVTDSLLNPTRVDRPLHKWALVSNYMYDPVGTRRMTEFYEAREKVGRANATLNELARTDLDRAAKYAEEHADELMLESAVNSTLEQLERARAYRKYLNSPDGAKEMSKEERESELQELRRMEVSLTGWLREAQTDIRRIK